LCAEVAKLMGTGKVPGDIGFFLIRDAAVFFIHPLLDFLFFGQTLTNYPLI
jgi:hypothetical protein